MTRALVVGDRMPRFAFLLSAMFLEFLFAPVFGAGPGGIIAARIVTAILLLAALLAVGVQRIPLVLFIATVGTHLLAAWTRAPWLEVGAPILRLVFLCYVFVLILGRVLRDRNVSYDTLAGAACGYMLLGLIWGELFTLVQLWNPESFHIPPGFVSDVGPDARPALVYFSFITLTTVGYGDIVPGWVGAGAIAASEAIFGQLYLAITISRLVGLHIADRGS